MGIWDDLRSAVTKFRFRVGPENQLIDKDAFPIQKDVGDAVKYNGARKIEDHAPDSDRREKIARVLNDLSKFAVESAVNDSLKGVTGGIQVNKLVKRGLESEPAPRLYNGSKKQDISLTVEEMQARRQKMQDDMDVIKHQSMVSFSMENANASEPLTDLSNEPIKTSAPPEKDRKRVFIRSRL